MEENNELIEELERNIEQWQNEIDTVWAGKDTDAAEVEKQRKELNRHLDRLKEERKNYESQKNGSYKDIYEEYTKQIKKIEEKLSKKAEKHSQEEKDRQIKVLTKGRMDAEKEIKKIEQQMIY